jgi:hypothetical protein
MNRTTVTHVFVFQSIDLSVLAVEKIGTTTTTTTTTIVSTIKELLGKKK